MKNHYSELNITDLKGNKAYWKIVLSFSSEKVMNFENITLVENNVTITSDTTLM